MSTVFEMIIQGKIPGRFVWKDDTCVGIMTIEPVSHGHALVVPREPIDKWTDLPSDVLAHLMEVAQTIGKAQEEAFDVPRTAVVIAGFEVPHAHIHVIPAKTEEQASLNAAQPASELDLESAATVLRAALVKHGHAENAQG